jgi:toxin CcdB
MARFDIYRNGAKGGGLLLDCQADLLAHLNTRLVAPLLPPADAPKPAGRLNPTFEVGGNAYVMVTQYASAIEVRELGPKIGSLAVHDHEIMNALDFLLTGI